MLNMAMENIDIEKIKEDTRFREVEQSARLGLILTKQDVVENVNYQCPINRTP